MPEDLANHTWDVTFDFNGTEDGRLIKAAYHRFVEGQPFIEFKDADHKTVFTVSADRVVTITRCDTSRAELKR